MNPCTKPILNLQNFSSSSEKSPRYQKSHLSECSEEGVQKKKGEGVQTDLAARKNLRWKNKKKCVAPGWVVCEGAGGGSGRGLLKSGARPWGAKLGKNNCSQVYSIVSSRAPTLGTHVCTQPYTPRLCTQSHVEGTHTRVLNQ